MSRPPGLLIRAVGATCLPLAAVLSLAVLVQTTGVRDRARTAEAGTLEVGARMLTALEARWRATQLAAATALARDPDLEAALEAYDAGRHSGDADPAGQALLRRVIARQADAIAAVAGPDALAVLDAGGRVIASAGRLGHRWTSDQTLDIGDPWATFEGVVVLPGGVFRIAGARLAMAVPGAGARDLGALVLATSLDDRYAREIAGLSGAGIVITVGDRIAASTVPDAVARALAALQAPGPQAAALDGDEHVMRVLLDTGQVRITMLAPVGAAAGVIPTLAAIALGGLLLAGLGGVWLARTVRAPACEAARVIAAMAASGDLTRRLDPVRAGRELDPLIHAFNALMDGIRAGNGETRDAHLGAIRALAAALDTRDPYAAGHSVRVSALSVRIARRMGLPDADVDVIRLGALLHDVGKIGVREKVLRKPGVLTEDEYEQITQHPTLGARILRDVPSLAPHLPIVELHHERPDGKGYPRRLKADAIPLAASIVRVADAFDAMTSARAYRPARPADAALEELRRHAGTQFDAACVEALCAAMADADGETAGTLERAS